MTHPRSRVRREGAIVPLVAISLVALLAVTGLVVDGGLLMAERRRAQNVADGAALAAAVDLLNVRGLPQAVKSGYEYADLSGYHTDSRSWTFATSGNPPAVAATLTQGDTTVVVNIPPVSGPRAGNSDFVEVIAYQRLKPFFIQVVGSGATQVGARAVAGVIRQPPIPYGMVALNRNGNGVEITGTGGFTIQAPVLTLSTDPTSLLLGGSPTAKSTGPLAGWYTNGGYKSVAYQSWTDGTWISAGGSFSPTPKPIPPSTPIVDPLINLPPPSRAGLQTYPAVVLSAGRSATLNPGIYTGGIKVTGNSHVTLNPGLYYIDGGGVQIGSYDVNGRPVSTDSSYMIANKVTFYNTGTPTTFGGFQLSYYGSQTTVTPPPQLAAGTSLDWTKGYPGMALFQDRANTKPVDMVNQVTPLQGTFYASAATLTFNGQGVNPAAPVQLVAGRIVVNTDTPNGNAETDVPYDAKVFAPPPEIYLVE
ncbi:MAG: hypothetical protein JWO38_2576 [Gemmataceae bacterium]|nr:hypothetical protein [Gemmataceae bacterium]